MTRVELSHLANETLRVQQTAKSATGYQEPVTFAQVHRAAVAESDERDMEWFRNRTYQDLAQSVVHRSVSNTAVDITAEGLRAMKHDPGYRQQVLYEVRRDFGTSYYPRQVNLHIHVGDTIDEYTAQTWVAGDDEAFREKSMSSFYCAQNNPATGRSDSSTVVDPGAYRFFRPQSAAGNRALATSAAYKAAAYGIGR